MDCRPAEAGTRSAEKTWSSRGGTHWVAAGSALNNLDFSQNSANCAVDWSTQPSRLGGRIGLPAADPAPAGQYDQGRIGRVVWCTARASRAAQARAAAAAAWATRPSGL